MDTAYSANVEDLRAMNPEVFEELRKALKQKPKVRDINIHYVNPKEPTVYLGDLLIGRGEDAANWVHHLHENKFAHAPTMPSRTAKTFVLHERFIQTLTAEPRPEVKDPVDFTADELAFLAVLTTACPSIGNNPFSASVSDEVAVKLRWTDERARSVFKSLDLKGAIEEVNHIWFLHARGRKAGLDELRRQEEQAKAKEKSSERRTFWVGFLSGIVSAIATTLICAYLVYRFGWNR